MEMCQVRMRQLNARVLMMHTLEEAEAATGVPLVHCGAPSIAGVWGEKLLLCCLGWNGEGFSLLTNEDGWMLPGKCVRQENHKRPHCRLPRAGRECCVETRNSWAFWLLKLIVDSAAAKL